jgi:cyclopropane fatty-acyl-phospholipid synthase-like methyltransferase
MNALKYWETQHQNRSKDEPLTPTDFAREIGEMVGKSSKMILDIGCAAGRDTLFFASKGHNITGIDISSMAVEIAGTNALKYDLQKNTKFISCDISQVVLPRKAFDVIYARMSLHYFTDSKLHDIIKKLTRALSFDGFIAVQLRSILDEKYGIGTSLAEDIFVDEEGHMRRFFDRSVAKKLFANLRIKSLEFIQSNYETAKGYKKSKLLTLIASVK